MFSINFNKIAAGLIAASFVATPGIASAADYADYRGDSDRQEFAVDGSEFRGEPIVEFAHRFGGPGALSDGPAGTCFGEKATIVASGFGVTYGTAGSDVIVGTDGDDVIYGLGGDDLICGFDGSDVIYGDHNDPDDSTGGLDTINGGEGDDHIYGGPKQDFLFGSADRDVIWGDLPNSPYGTRDNIEGGNGADVIIGGRGDDLVWGDRKNFGVWTYGREDGFGNDVIDAVTDNAGGHDEIWAGAGNDYIFAADGVGQNIWGQSGTDTCELDAAIDVFQCEVLI